MTADTLSRTSHLGAYAEMFAASPLNLVEEPYSAMAVVRRQAADGWPEANSADIGTRTTIWLGPDEWLVTDSTVTPDRLRVDLEDSASVATDVSAQRTTVRLRGRHAREVLAKGCSVDLHPSVSPPGTAVQTGVARTGVILLVVGNDRSGLDARLLVRSSYAAYLADWLLDAALEYAP